MYFRRTIFFSIILLSIVSLTSCSTILEFITGTSTCAYPGCNEFATENSAYCEYHTPSSLRGSTLTPKVDIQIKEPIKLEYTPNLKNKENKFKMKSKF